MAPIPNPWNAYPVDYVRLGCSGLKVSRIGLGMMSYGDPAAQSWALPEDQAEPIVRRAVEAGVTFFDTADMYSGGASEVITGRLLTRLFARREDYVLATKVFYPTGSGPNDRGLSRKHLLASVDASLQRLGTEYVDLYQVHRFDPETPVEETVQALDDIVRAGKARYVGASAMYAWQFAKLQMAAAAGGWTRFVSMQNRYNLVNREDERELIPTCLDMGVGVVPYSPLARGLLAGNRSRTGERRTKRAESASSDRLEDFDVQDAVLDTAQRLNVAPAQVAIAWLHHKPGVCAPIVGATKRAHITDAVASLDLELGEEDVAVLEHPYLPRLLSDFS
jgi:aryl-alcohol dehydrogenase-like predicted oxidoreductase